MKHTLMLLAAFLLAPLAALDAAELSRPNILWIVAEDINPNFGCYGDAYAVTPVLDKLAQESIRFTQCFAEAPACAPSRFTLITGMHAGPYGTSQMRSRHPLPEHIKGFPSYLRAVGYYCSNNDKTDYNCGDATRFIRESWDESSRKAHWRNRKPGQPFFAVFNYVDTHQSRAS